MFGCAYLDQCSPEVSRITRLSIPWVILERMLWSGYQPNGAGASVIHTCDRLNSTRSYSDIEPTGRPPNPKCFINQHPVRSHLFFLRTIYKWGHKSMSFRLHLIFSLPSLKLTPVPAPLLCQVRALKCYTHPLTSFAFPSPKRIDGFLLER